MLAFANDLRLSKKILAAFAVLSVLFCGITVNSYMSDAQLKGVAQGHVRGLSSMSALADLISDIKEQRIIVYSYLNAAGSKDMSSLEDRMEKAIAKTNTDLEGYGRILDPEFRGEFTEIQSLTRGLASTNAHIFALKKQGDFDGALKLIKGDGKTQSRAAIDQAEKLIDLTTAQSDRRDRAGNAQANKALALSLFLSAAGFAGLILVWLLIDRSIAKPIARITDVTTRLAEGGQADVPYRVRKDELGEIARAVEQFRLAAISRAEEDARLANDQKIVMSSLSDSLAALTIGDLGCTIDTDFPMAYAELKNHFNAAIGSLSELIGSITESTQAIRTGADEIAKASEDLARRTESNAASLEETSAAIVEMDERLKATAGAASSTVHRADDALAVVSTGREIAASAVAAMGQVSDSATGIDSVIEGLDKIAFQTRVLAMNAAVEAGRAGDAGRGFAVVADLVSSLAMRAEEEAKRARDQLTVTQTDIATAVEAVQRVDGALQNISSNVGEVHVLVGGMSNDNQAQSAAVSEISAAISSMDRSTQQNAAMVEETSAAARNLTHEINALAEHASLFRTETKQKSSPSSIRKPKSFAPMS